MTALARARTERIGMALFCGLGLLAAVVKIGLVATRGPNQGYSVVRALDAQWFGPLRPADLDRLRSLLRPGQTYAVLDAGRYHELQKTVVATRLLLGWELLPNAMVARPDEADLLVREYGAPVPHLPGHWTTRQLDPNLQALVRVG